MLHIQSKDRFFASLVCFLTFFLSAPVFSESNMSVDELLAITGKTLRSSPEKAIVFFKRLKDQESSFTKDQKEHYFLLYASLLGLQGSQVERISLVQSIIKNVVNPDLRVKFLYELTDAYTSQADYENALKTINESVLLLPATKSMNAKVSTLSAAISLFGSLHAFDDAIMYAERLYFLGESEGDLFAKCYGLANLLEINFLSGNSVKARSYLREGIETCNKDSRKMMALVLKTLAAIDSIDAVHSNESLETGNALLIEYSKENQSSSYRTQLESAMAQGYLKNENFAKAELYGLEAYRHSASENAIQLMEKTSETMAKIKRAQGQQKSAFEYYDINLALKQKVLDDQLHKNLAYQRVKFDMQDKANQLTLLEQKNKLLTTEKQLQFGKNQNLLLLITLGTILLTILGAWLIRTLQLKNFFRTSSQIDGLTQVCNRSHFVMTTTKVFKNPDKLVSLILLDMDHFKKINDTFGHATGDWVLKTMTATVMGLISKTDVFGRLGGEEFAICVPGASEAEVLALAERCRSAIAHIVTDASGFAFPISASFGIATRGTHKLFSFDETLAAADKALYVSKSEGRNRVSVYE